MENKEEVRVKVGDVMRVVDSDKVLILGDTLICTEATKAGWRCVGKNGKQYQFTNPPSSLFEFDKNTIVINILNDL